MTVHCAVYALFRYKLDEKISGAKLAPHWSHFPEHRTVPFQAPKQYLKGDHPVDTSSVDQMTTVHTTKHLHSGTFVLNRVMFMFRSGGVL